MIFILKGIGMENWPGVDHVLSVHHIFFFHRFYVIFNKVLIQRTTWVFKLLKLPPILNVIKIKPQKLVVKFDIRESENKCFLPFVSLLVS